MGIGVLKNGKQVMPRRQGHRVFEGLSCKREFKAQPEVLGGGGV